MLIPKNSSSLKSSLSSGRRRNSRINQNILNNESNKQTIKTETDVIFNQNNNHSQNSAFVGIDINNMQEQSLMFSSNNDNNLNNSYNENLIICNNNIFNANSLTNNTSINSETKSE